MIPEKTGVKTSRTVFFLGNRSVHHKTELNTWRYV